jgi:ParB family chromosome partitioning protein
MSITDPEQQYEMAKYIVENGDSVRDIEKKVKVRKKVSKKKISKYEPIYRDIENTFQSFFGTKVKLDAGEKKGKIIINYSSNDDLERILGLIK